MSNGTPIATEMPQLAFTLSSAIIENTGIGHAVTFLPNLYSDSLDPTFRGNEKPAIGACTCIDATHFIFVFLCLLDFGDL